jgi:hypothetical protein
MSEKDSPGAPASAHGADQDAAGQQPDPYAKSEIAAPDSDDGAGAREQGAVAPTAARSITTGAEIKRLAAMRELDYRQERRSAAKRLGIVLSSLDQLVREERQSSVAAKPESQRITPKIDFKVCEELATNSRILDHMASEIERLGLVGEHRAAKLVYLVLSSRVLERPICAAVKGPPSTGKNRVVEDVLKFFPEPAFYRLTSMSQRALAYGTEPLQHRTLVLEEASGLPEGIGAYLIRSLISEGRIRYETVESTPYGLRSVVIDREGPTGLLVTTTKIEIEFDLETRMLSIPVLDTPEQTSAVLMGTAAQFSGRRMAEVDLAQWHALQVWLEQDGARSAIVPYAEKIAAAIPPVDNRLRRDFECILKLIQMHAILHQAQGERDGQGRVIATLDDYSAVYDLVADLVGVAVEAGVSNTVRETVEAVRELTTPRQPLSPLQVPYGVSLGKVAEHLKLDKSSTSRRVAGAISAGYLSNLEIRKGRPGRYVLGDPLPEERSILPRPDTLMANGGVASGIEQLPAPEAVAQLSHPISEVNTTPNALET